MDRANDPWDLLFAADHPPGSWTGDRQFPWRDPAFSERMLSVHLDQSTHMASRTADVIDAHVDWLVRLLDEVEPSTSPRAVLDVGCGPGLYCHGLARRGLRALGFDYAPAPLRWARRVAASEGLACTFREADLTNLPEDFAGDDAPFQAITIWYCEFQSFPPDTARAFLHRLRDLLAPGGRLVIEYQPWASFVQDDGSQWSVETRSALCDVPHLWLQEYGWDPVQRVETHTHWILEQTSGALHRYTQCYQAYTDDDLVALLAEAGLGDCVFYGPITGADAQHEFPLIVARVREADRT